MTTGFENTLTIRRPPEEVFEYLADFENVPRWNYAIVETRKESDGPVGVGSRYVQRRSIPQPATERFEVTEFEPPRRLGVEGTIGPFPARVRYELTPAPDGTRLTNAVDLELSGPKRLLGAVAVGRVKGAVAENLDVLRQLLEA